MEPEKNSASCLRLLRAPKLKSDEDSKNCYLLTIGDTGHVMFIPNIQEFFRVTRPGNRTPSSMSGGEFCKICMNFIKSADVSWHFDQCYNLKKDPNVRMPEKGSKFKFTSTCHK